MQSFEHERQSIRVLEAVAKYGNVSQAAEKLFLTQPTVSKLIRQQEKRYGVSLIDRSKHPLKLTYAGEFYLEQMRQLVNQYQVLRHDLSHFGDHQVGRLTIGVNPTLAQFVLPVILLAFHRQYPQIQIQLVERTSVEMEADVLNEKLDLYIGIKPGFDPRLRYQPLFVGTGTLLMPRQWPANRQRVVADISPLVNERDFIQETEDSGFQRIVNSYLTKYGVRPHTVLRTANISTAASLTRGGLGATIVPQALLSSLDVGAFQVVTIAPDALQCEVTVVSSGQHPQSISAQRFVALALKRFATRN